jgi:hypothetical protein
MMKQRTRVDFGHDESAERMNRLLDKLPRVPLPRQRGGAHQTRRNEPARKRKHKGQEDE